MNLLQKLKKFLILLFAAITLCIVSFGNLLAQETGEGGQNEIYYLNLIEQHTKDILERVNTLPLFLTEMLRMAVSWNKTDDTSSTALMQVDFTNIGLGLRRNFDPARKVPILKQITADMLGAKPSDLEGDSPRIIAKLAPWNPNDVSYGTIFGTPPVPKTFRPESAYRYLKNASGLSIPHEIPSPINMTGDPANYFVYWPVVMAAESFNAYVLTNRLADPPFTAAQGMLIDKASKAEWFTAIAATEDLGQIFRQLLLFISQSYLLQTQQLQTERDILAATIINNTLLIATNRDKENIWVSRAKGEQPKG